MDQIVDLDEEALAAMSEDERDLVKEALEFEEDSCFTAKQARRLKLIEEDEDRSELRKEGREHRQVLSPPPTGAHVRADCHARCYVMCLHTCKHTWVYTQGPRWSVRCAGFSG